MAMAMAMANGYGHGPWAMGRGPWAMGPGPWALGHGPWAMGHGPPLRFIPVPVHTGSRLTDPGYSVPGEVHAGFLPFYLRATAKKTKKGFSIIFNEI